MERFDVAVVGAGLIGSAVAWELTRLGTNVVVLEAADRVAAGVSGTNSGLVCTGFDAKSGTLELKMIRVHAERWRSIFDSLEVPYRVPGALIAARADSERESLVALAARAAENGVEAKVLDAAQVEEHQPGLTAEAGLFVAEEAITDPYEVVRRLLAAVGDVRFGWAVEQVELLSGDLLVGGSQGAIAADFVVNCAGLHADEIASDGSFEITPRRGSFLAYGPETSGLLNHILLPLPTEHTKGVLLFPTVHDRVVAGPTAVDIEDKRDWNAPDADLHYVRTSAEKTLPALQRHRAVQAWAGLRTVGHPRDYIVEWSHRVPRLLSICGVRSTGLSSFLGLSALAARKLADAGLKLNSEPKLSMPRPSDTKIFDSARPWWERLPQCRGVASS